MLANTLEYTSNTYYCYSDVVFAICPRNQWQEQWRIKQLISYGNRQVCKRLARYTKYTSSSPGTAEQGYPASRNNVHTSDGSHNKKTLKNFISPNKH